MRITSVLTDPRFVRAMEKTLNAGLGGIARRLENGPGFLPEGADLTHGFYPGAAFREAPAPGAKWRLGYAAADLTPTDWRERSYYLGGYLTGANGFDNRVENVIDKMMCRIAALDDGSGRGVTLLATVDCIGLGNRHVKEIRRHLEDLMRISGCEETLCSVNVFSTHAHSCVDTQGLWTATGKKLLHNWRKNRSGRGTYLEGADPEFMRRLVRLAAEGMLRAVKDLRPGTLAFAEKDVTDAYFSNRNRPSATALTSRLIRFIFTPEDPAARPTALVSFAAHPDVAGLPTTDGQSSGRELCGEFVYYMGAFMERAGYNMLFINGAICAVYMARGASNDGVTLRRRYEQSVRYGTELAKIALALTKTAAEIEADPVLCDAAAVAADREESEKNGAPYTLWYENWAPAEEKDVPPLLNIRLRQITLDVTNPLIILVGKLNLAAYDVTVKKDGGYQITTEVGLLELGGAFRAVLAPGELCQDLLFGGASLGAAGSFWGVDFGLPPIADAYGAHVWCFGLANDAIGYIVPDNDYVLGEFAGHYHELISLGAGTGSAVVRAITALKEENA